MKVTDLTYMIHADMPAFPGTEPPLFKSGSTLEKEGFIETILTFYSHTGTHIDAPSHILDNDVSLDNLAIDHFIGKATVLDFSTPTRKIITLKEVQAYQDIIKQVEFIILKTGWSKFWGISEYYQDFPALDKKAAAWLADYELKGIGIDAISIDKIEDVHFPVHRIFMKKNTLIMENIANLDALQQQIFTLCVFPLKYKNSDGSPVRAVAIED
jgi:kynurenine formamidase